MVAFLAAKPTSEKRRWIRTDNPRRCQSGEAHRWAAQEAGRHQRREIAEAVVISGRKTAAQMARMFGVPPPTVSRIVAAYVVAQTSAVQQLAQR